MQKNILLIQNFLLFPIFIGLNPSATQQLGAQSSSNDKAAWTITASSIDPTNYYGITLAQSLEIAHYQRGRDGEEKLYRTLASSY